MRRSFRTYAALLLVLGAGFDLLIVDFGIFSFCSDDAGSNAPNDDCFCCCSHIVLAPLALLQPGEVIEFADPPPSLARPRVAHDRVYHPPRTASLTA
jgi:hypothetical protein